MQKDFHYYVIAILAKHAGFTDKEAATIATASQYVDDATESFQINFDNGRIMETTMTAHYHVKAFNPGVQKKVYMCFHFPPRGYGRKDKTFSFETVRNSRVINYLLDTIHDEKRYEDRKQPNRRKKTLDGKRMYLFQLGIALHTYADSWAHNSFSGRHNKENNVGKIWFWKNEKWDRKVLAGYALDLAFQIGHMECGHYPDQPFREMKYALYDPRVSGKVEHERRNPRGFIQGSKKCLDWLYKFKTNRKPTKGLWDPNADAMKAISRLVQIPIEDGEKRIKRWRQTKEFRPYRSFFKGKNEYDKSRWRKEAFKPKETKNVWGEKKRRDSLEARDVWNYSKSSLRFFHKAARQQRAFILDKLFW